jgi:hypothetical protein
MRAITAKVMTAATAGVVAGATLLAPVAAHAAGSASVRGFCDGGSILEMRASSGGGQIKINLRVDTPFGNRQWTARITDNATTVFSGSKFVSGNSFTLDVNAKDLAGPDKITVNASAGPLACETRSLTI